MSPAVRAVLFDLDDTLYPEIDFVRSGFGAAARWLASRFDLDEDRLARRMMELLERDGRGHVLDDLLGELHLRSDARVRTLLQIYRSHRPALKLHEDAAPTLARLRESGVRTGLVTDGMASVQRRKIEALGLERMLDAVVCSDEIGPRSWKPSGDPYLVVLEMLGAAPGEAAYVGDDASKDFVWPNGAGMTTIRIERARGGGGPGPRAGSRREEEPGRPGGVLENEARHVVARLRDILPILGA